MDAKDLMVGDIVLYLDDADLISVKVLNIDGQSEAIRVQQANGHMFNVMAESLIPSPLKAEILRSNGFSDNVNSGWIEFKESVSLAPHDGKVEIDVELRPNLESKLGVWEIKGFGQFHAFIRFLHQLQHCMKIIGFKKEFVLN